MANGPILITGATGFVGGHLLDRFLDHDRIVAWARPDGRAADRARHNVVWRAVDVLDRDAVQQAIAADVPSEIYHLAGPPHLLDSWQQPQHHLRVHALGTHHLLEAVRLGAPAARVVVVTSGMIYRASDTPVGEDAALGATSPYGTAKLAEDQLALDAARQYGLAVLVARPFNHAGPRQSPAFALSSFAQQIARMELGEMPPELATGNIDARRDITDVRDVVAAYERIMRNGVPGRAYNVATGRAHRIGDLIEMLTKMAALHVRAVVDPARLRPVDQAVIVGDPSRIQSELGWCPGISIEVLLRDTLDWWRKELRRTT